MSLNSAAQHKVVHKSASSVPDKKSDEDLMGDLELDLDDVNIDDFDLAVSTYFSISHC